MPKEQLSTRFAAAICDGIAPCCQTAGLAYDGARCKSTLALYYQDELLADANLPGVTYDANAAGECLAWIQSVVSACYASEQSTACERIFVGSLPAGSACERDIQCARPTGGEAYCSDGVCEQQPRAKLGEPCNSTCSEEPSGGTSCGGYGSGVSGTCYTNDGLQCESGICQPLGTIGEPCGYSGCVETAFCNAGTCAAKLPIGASCVDTYDDDVCEAGVCGPDGICAVKKPTGAACTSDMECEFECDQGSCVPGEPIAEPELCSGSIG